MRNFITTSTNQAYFLQKEKKESQVEREPRVNA